MDERLCNMYQEMKIIDFLNEVDSPSPAPGGGSVAALCGSLGVALSRMYAHLSISKKRFKDLDETVQIQFLRTFQMMEAKRSELLEAIDQDSEAYNTVMEAIHMPKDSDEQRTARSEAMQKATITAIESPYHIMELSTDIMSTFMDIIPFGNKNAVSDIAVGVLMLDTAVKSAGYNVRINLSSLQDDALRTAWQKRMEEQLTKSESWKTLLLREAEKYL